MDSLCPINLFSEFNGPFFSLSLEAIIKRQRFIKAKILLSFSQTLGEREGGNGVAAVCGSGDAVSWVLLLCLSGSFTWIRGRACLGCCPCVSAEDLWGQLGWE